MNRGVLQSSPVQQIMAAGNPNWWCSTNGIRAPEASNYSSTLFPPFPPSPPSSSGWHDNDHSQLGLQESWTELLRDHRGGLVGEEEDQKSGLSSFQAKRVNTWQEQDMLEHVSSHMEHVKQENNSATSYLYGHHPNDQDLQLKSSPLAPTNNWSSLSSSPKSCITSYGAINTVLNFSTNISKRHPPPNRSTECSNNAAGGAQKKARVQSSSTTQSLFKVRKEKLGDRIAALHQIISPFGKTDTASVLLEATGYIRFLHSQIEALSLPYLGKNQGDLKHKVSNNYSMRRKGAPDPQGCGEDVQDQKDLRSRGLCLVPISCTIQDGNENMNGADYWAQAFLGREGGGSGGFR